MRRCLRRILLIVPALLGVGPAIAQPVQIRVSYTAGGDVSAAFVARARGMFQARNLDVSLTATAFGSNIPAALQSGTLEIGTPTAPVLLLAAAGGLDLVPISGGSVAMRTSKDHAVLARSGLDLRTANDFVGRRIGMAGFGGFLDLLFEEWLKRNGVSPSRVNMVEMGQPLMNDALKGASVDAVVAADPNVTRMQQTGAGRVVLYIDSQFPDDLPVIVYAGAQAWAASHREAAQSFAAAIAEASTYALAHPDELRRIIADYTKLPPEVVAAASLPDLHASLTADQLALWNPILRSQGALSADVDTAKMLQW